MDIILTVVMHICGGIVIGSVFLVVFRWLEAAASRRTAARLHAEAKADDLRRARAQRIRDKELGSPIEWQDNRHLDTSLLHVKHEGPLEK